VPFDLAAHDLALLVMDTRAEHALVDGQYAQRRRSCEQAAAELGVTSLREVPFGSLEEALGRLPDPVVRRRAKHIVTEIERVRQTVALLREDRVEEVGALFDASHLSMRDDFEISAPELDVAVETAVAHGSLGARMTGGGFGGSAIAIVPAGAVEAVTEAVTKAFADHGFTSPSCFAVTASGPAGRDA
jgi:galactokinase